MFLVYKECTTGGEICKGEEDDDYPSREDEFVEFHPVSLHINTPKEWCYERIKIDWEPNVGDYLYLVVARYFDGDTFGTTRGRWNIIKLVKTMKEAEALTNKIYKEKPKQNHKDDIYRPWIGYFSGLEHIEIYPMRTQV